MLGPVVDQVATLAKGYEVGAGVVERVVVAVRGSQHHTRPAGAAEHVIAAELQSDQTPTAVAPALDLHVPPATIAEMDDHLLVRSSAALASSSGPAKADRGRKLRPVDRVEEAMLAPDRHAKVQSGRKA